MATRPDDDVAEKIVDQLRPLGLFDDSALRKLRRDLALGDVSAANWRSIFEHALRPRVATGEQIEDTEVDDAESH